MSNKSWTVEVEQAPDGEYFIQLTDEMLEHTDFKIGDEVEWIDRKDGSWELRKKQPEMAWVLVEAVQQFRMRYMVQVPASNPEWALDTVTMQEAKEFSQENMGETIVSHRVISEEEAFELCDKDNDYTRSWDREQKMRAFFTKDGEKVEL